MDTFDTRTNSTAATDAAIDTTIVIASLLILLIFVIVSYAVSAFLLGRIFKKAGLPQWTAWVPIYNYWKLLELGNQQGFWAIIAALPFVGIISVIFIYIAMYHIGKKLGKEDWFVLLAIFVPFVWLVWLGFDDSQWPKNNSTALEGTSRPLH